jgi:hypothetical protein
MAALSQIMSLCGVLHVILNLIETDKFFEFKDLRKFVWLN